MHVALVGKTGVGKSTLVNVLKGEQVAEVNNNVRPCTTQPMSYEVVEGDARYCIWDTRGLEEASEQSGISRMLKLARMVPDAERGLKNFLCGDNPRIDLVLLCIDAKKIRVNIHWKIYNKIYTDLCEKRLRVAIVVTHMCERDFGGWKTTCEVAARGVVDEFPTASLMEAVPMFEGPGDPRVEECKRRIMGLISSACRRIARSLAISL
ncbi:P-loop containing nucleoside triphosphate hydrolase protein [Chiua virens]|nr:P-loop containing nucleoside triphosphate hydrolase protein [Chiua virens]